MQLVLTHSNKPWVSYTNWIPSGGINPIELLKLTGTYALPASTGVSGAGGVTGGVVFGASGDNGAAWDGDSGFLVVSDL